ncbi:MAG: TolC family protein [Ferruginibacter sp.]
MKIIFLNACLVMISFFTTAQNKLTLKQAIETGIANNLEVNQADLQSQRAGINLKQSRANMLPDLNATADHGINQGRSIDPISNGFINQQFSYGSYGAGSNLLLFNGLSLQNNIKGNALAYNASKMELQQAKDNLTINIILAYLQVLSSQDILARTKDQVMVTGKQVDRLDVLNKAGAIKPAEYFDLKGQYANDEIAIVENQAAYETAKLNLAQLLNIPYDKNVEVERLPEETFNMNYENTPEKVYQSALTQFALIRSVHLRSLSAAKQVRSIKGELYPSLFLSGNANTNYSSAATQQLFVSSTDVASTDYVVINGTQQPVFTRQETYNSKKINYGSQLNNNLFTSVNLGLSIPIFNANKVRNRIRIAKLDQKNYELIEQNTKTVLQQSIERAYVNLTSTSNKYKILTDQVNSFTESFRGAEIRFNAGAITSVDYLIAKNNLDRSKTNLIIAKYDFVLRSKILDYYEGKALW